jgi:hypothetical protein
VPLVFRIEEQTKEAASRTVLNASECLPDYTAAPPRSHHRERLGSYLSVDVCRYFASSIFMAEAPD